MPIGRGWLVVFLVGAPLLALADPPAQSPPAERPAPANAPPAANLRPEAQRLVDLLGSGRFWQRLAAMDDLEKLGPTILPDLHDAAKKPTDPEVRRRLEEVILKLETAGALKPTLITLKVTDQPLRKIAEAIGRQAGYRIEVWPPAGADERDKRLLSVDFQNISFWEAIQQLCELGGMILQEGWYGNDNMTIRLQLGDALPGFVSLDGPFRVVARSLNYSRNLDLGGNRPGANQAPAVLEPRRQEWLNLNLTISVEPRLPLYGVGQPNLEEALDDLSQSLKPLPSQAQTQVRQSYYSGYRGYMQSVALSLNPMANGRRIKSLKGTIPVTLIALQRPKIVVEKLGEVKNQTFKSGLTTLVLEDVTKNGNQVTLKLNVTEALPRGVGQDYSWLNTVMQRLEVLDDKGVKMQSFSSSWGMNGNSVQGTFTYGGAGGGTPSRLIYYDWITLSHDVPFTFQDLPLP
jgi:hypothetical protein